MSPERMRWLPAFVLLVGSGFVYGGVQRQVSVPLEAPLDEVVPETIQGMESRDIEISAQEQAVAGMSSYVLREYLDPESGQPLASIYVGYYTQQARGKTIHSPKNCLPGGGWEPLTSGTTTIPTPNGNVRVNRWLIGNGPAKAMVLYWYQGRGRVAASEYGVKWDLLRDQALYGRSDEALVRVIVPVETSEEEALRRASSMAEVIVPLLEQALPGKG